MSVHICLCEKEKRLVFTSIVRTCGILFFLSEVSQTAPTGQKRVSPIDKLRCAVGSKNYEYDEEDEHHDYIR